MNKNSFIILRDAKKCGNCFNKTTEGKYLVLRNDKTRQRWICNSCIDKGHRP